MFDEVTSPKKSCMPPVFMYAPIPALSMDWLVAGVRLLGLELVWGSQKMELEIRYFEGGWSRYIRDYLEEGLGGECWGLLE
jgi:hypothetical protein